MTGPSISPTSGRPMTVELSAAQLIDDILSSVQPQHKPTGHDRAKSAAAAAVPYQRAGRRRSCRCGVCLQCVDNARWERIFEAKFADPTYYLDRAVRHESSLR